MSQLWVFKIQPATSVLFQICPIRMEYTLQLCLRGFMCGSSLFIFCLGLAFSCSVDKVIFGAFFDNSVPMTCCGARTPLGTSQKCTQTSASNTQHMELSEGLDT